MPPKRHITTTQKTSLSNEQRRGLCEHYQQNTQLKQYELQNWVEATYGVSISQGTVSNILRQSDRYVHGAGYTNPNERRRKMVKHPTMDDRLGNWVVEKQETVAISGDIIKNRGRQMLTGIDHDLKFSNGWLSRFKKRKRIAAFKRHGEDGSVDEELVRQSLPGLREQLDKYGWENIYNMDETGLYYRMEVSRRICTL